MRIYLKTACKISNWESINESGAQLVPRHSTQLKPFRSHRKAQLQLSQGKVTSRSG
jgi:hypothetical protein